MKVYKYCESQFNPLEGCRTICLGNNRTFRKNYKGEDDFINDRHEGTATGSDAKGNFFLQSKFYPDGLLYCTSTAKLDMELVKEYFDKNYDSCYAIKDIDAFSDYILNILIKDLSPSSIHSQHHQWIDGFIKSNGLSNEKFMQGMQVKPYSGVVDYKHHGQLIIPDMFNADILIPLGNFTKLEIYKNQNEHRNVFTLRYDLKKSDNSSVYFDYAPDRMILDVPDIMNYVERC